MTEPASFRGGSQLKNGVYDWMQIPLFKHLIEQFTWVEAISAPEEDIINKLN